jgi:hypothetical protein
MHRPRLTTLCLALSVLAAAASAPAGATVIPYSGSIATYTVAQTGTYGITAVGGSGGNSRGSLGASAPNYRVRSR